jgi:protein-S-isoprenylcysteine O-methyltransferase Ste14
MTPHDDPSAGATAGVAAPPPLIFLGFLALGLLFDRVARSGDEDDEREFAPYASALGNVALASGAAIGASAIVSLKSVGTNLSPYKPTTALATGGPFRFSRNPAYVGMTALYMGIALRARSMMALLYLPMALAVLDRAVVSREERYLEATFGEEYRAYKERTPRWF